MGSAEIIAGLKEDKAKLAELFGVEELALFGSYARGDENPESDIDILIKLRTPSYSSLMSIMRYFEKKFHKKIDLVRKGPHLTERFFKIVGKDIIYV